MQRVAILTGALGGIGKKITELLGDEKVNLVISDVFEPGEDSSQLISEWGSSIKWCRADLTFISDIKRLVQFTITEFGRIDILINNAGICLSTPVDCIDIGEWDRVLNVNLRSVMFCCQEVMPYITKSTMGRIINLSSLAGKVGGIVAGAHYSASKAGVISLTKTYAQALAPYGVTVNAVCPGVIDTPMQQVFSESERQRLISGIPLGRVGTAFDVANIILYLISDKAGFITGEVVDVNGGSYMD